MEKRREEEREIFKTVLTEDQLLKNRKVFGYGPLSFARQRYEYIKMMGDEMHYNEYMYKGLMLEECRKADLIISERYNELYQKYRMDNPDNLDLSDFENEIKLSYAADNYAREVVYKEYVCSPNQYYLENVDEYEEDE